MIEKMLRVKAKIFRYGTVISYSSGEGKAAVRIGETTVSIKTTRSLSVGDLVVLVRNDSDLSWLVVGTASKALPSKTTLILA